MAAENVISYDTDTIQSIVNTDLSGLSSLNASTYSDEYLTQDFIAKIFDKLNVGDQSALNRWNTIVTQVNGYITSLEETPVPDDVTADPVVNEAPPIGDEAPLPEEEKDPVAETLQRVLDGELGPDTPHINPETLAAGVGIGLGAGIGTNPIDGVQPADVAGTPGVEPELPKQPENQPQPEHVQNGDVMDLQGTPGVKPELPKDANMDLHVEGERAPELPKGSGNQTQPETPTQPAIDVNTDPRFQAPPQPEQPVVEPTEQAKPGIDVNTDPRFQAPKQPGNQPQPEHVQNGDVMDLQGTPGVKPELPKDANMDLHVEGERAPELPKGPGNPTQPEIDAVSGAAPVVEPTEQSKPGIDVNTDPRFQAPKQPEQPEIETPPVESGKPAIDVNTDPRFQAPPQPEVPTEPTVEPAKEPAKPAIDVNTDPRFQAPPQPEKPVEQPTVTPQPEVPTEPTVEPAKEPGKPAIDVNTDPRFQAPTQPEQPKVEPSALTQPEQPERAPQPETLSFGKTDVFNSLLGKLSGGSGQQKISLGLSSCNSYMESNNLTTEQFMMGINDGSIVLTDPNAVLFINALKSTASSDYGTISSTETLVQLMVRLFGILM